MIEQIKIWLRSLNAELGGVNAHIAQYARSHRFWWLVVIPVFAVIWLFLTDPDDGGQSTKDMLQNVIVGGIGVTAAYIFRRGSFPYIKLEDLYKSVREKGDVASAIVTAAVILFTAALALAFISRAHAVNVQTYIPAGAYTFGPILKAEQQRLMPSHPMPSYFGSLVEQESCISLTHSRCWNAKSRLKTYAEEGASFGQITRKFNKDGSVKADYLAATKRLDPSLSEWSWDNVYKRPDLALRAIVVMTKDCHRRMSKLIRDKKELVNFCDSEYNGGPLVQQERRSCGQRPGCDPQKWFGNVERICLRSKVKRKGYGASACDINREHVQMVVNVRRHKYIPLMGGT